MTEQNPSAASGEPGEPEHGAPVHHEPTPTDPYGLRVPPAAGSSAEPPQWQPTITAGPVPGAPPAGPGGPPQGGGPPQPGGPLQPGGHSQPGGPPPLGPPQQGGPPQPGGSPPPARRGGRRGRIVGAAAALTLVAATVGGATGGVIGYSLADRPQANGSSALDAAKPPARQASDAPAGSAEEVAAKVLPTVVQIQVRGRTGTGEGSGVIISADGLILTNNHVVEGAANGGQLRVVFNDGRQADATIVGRDPSSDLAVIRADGVSGLTPAELGRSDDLAVGQEVIAIGSPLGLSGTVTTGIVSALNRPVLTGGQSSDQTTVLDAIQTDAAINPGNSGGPLVDSQGRVIGINSAIASISGGGSQSGSIGLGFAIPIDQARRIADELVKDGKATQAVLGVGVGDAQINGAQSGGAQISRVEPGGPADQAGIKAGEIVTKVGDRRIEDGDALVAAIRSHAPGDKVTLTVGDGTNQRTVEVTLGSRTVEPN